MLPSLSIPKYEDRSFKGLTVSGVEGQRKSDASEQAKPQALPQLCVTASESLPLWIKTPKLHSSIKFKIDGLFVVKVVRCSIAFLPGRADPWILHRRG